MENAQLTVSDLASLRSLLQAAYARGAFKIEESSQVGVIFDRLSQFLEAQQQATEAPVAPEQGEKDA